MLDQITPLILTFNEAPNIIRTLVKLSWAKDIVIVDSESTDNTHDLLSTYPNVRLFVRPFTTHAEQWNYGLEQTSISTDWVLALDADYVLTDLLIQEIAQLKPINNVGGYRANFTYCVGGKSLRQTIYPPVVVLYRRKCAEYMQHGHTQRVQIDGRIETLAGKILHDDRKPLVHWLASQARYMKLEADKIRNRTWSELDFPDRVRKLRILSPVAMAFYCLFVKGLVLEGKAGLFYTMQRAIAEMILSLYLLEGDLGGEKK